MKIDRVTPVPARRGGQSPLRWWEDWLPKGRGYSHHKHVARLLGVADSLVYGAYAPLSHLEFYGAASVLAQRWTHDAPLGAGPTSSDGVPAWTTIDLFDGSPPLRLPTEATGPVTWDGRQMVVCLTPSAFHKPASARVYSRRGDAQVAESLLAHLQRVHSGTHVFGRRFLQAKPTATGIELTPRPLPSTTRADVRLPDGMWDELHRSVVQTLHLGARLAGTPLAGHRGVVLYGPPGTGKTSIGRALARELVGDVTVIEVIDDSFRTVYDMATALAPTLVLIEDVDAYAPRRGQSVDGRLGEFLNALDGLGRTDAPIVTLMTTNDLRVLDGAARRAGRIDVVIEVPRPTRAGREAILGHLLANVKHNVDVSRVARAADGCTAADLREYVRRSAFTGGGTIEHDAMMREIADSRDWSPAGAYL
jgi:hypothetical protein